MRSEVLATYGYHVLRFKNAQVLNDLPTVLERIVATAHGIDATR